MLSSTSLLVNLITLYSLASITTASSLGLEGVSDITLAARSNCGWGPESCGTCSGANFPSLGYGYCMARSSQGCQCETTCTSSNDYCNHNNCQGINDPNGGLGLCTAGYYEGCPCLSICPSSPIYCNWYGCSGINLPAGATGICTAGDYLGCPCISLCGDKDGDCSSNGCNGLAGVCQGGDSQGCPCGTACGNLESQGCDQYGCNGINVPDMGLGICTGAYNGCSCQLVCPEPDVVCSDPNCNGTLNGANWVCSSGTYSGCYCASS
jgi:hypothetical protein